MKIIKSILLAAIGLSTVAMAQTFIKGGERFAYNALPTRLSIHLHPGEKRVFTLEETLSNGCLWQARPQNPSQQILTTHTLLEATGGQHVPMGVANIEITGNIANMSVVDFVLTRPGDPNATPIASIRAHINVVAPPPVVAAPPAPVVVAPPAPVAPVRHAIPQAPVLPPKPLLMKNEFYYPFREVPAVVDIPVPKDGNDIEFYLECPNEREFEWIAVRRDNINIKIDIDNNVERDAFVPVPGQHPQKRTIRCTSVEISGYEPCDGRLRLEYRKKGSQHAPATKVIECTIRVR